ncbi:MAG: Bax inhibitor-1/YccA family protein [Pseudomonadota bacterium]
MAQFDSLRQTGVGVSAEIDAGLRAHMNKVYGLMSVAMVITGLIAYVVGMDFRAVVNNQPTTIFPADLIVTMFNSPLRWVIMFAPLAFVFGLSMGINRLSAATAQMLFYVFAGVMGLSIAWIFAVFTGMSIAQIFFATAIMFASISIYGYTTKKDLSGWGSFLFMGLIGIVVASIINIFIGSPALMFAISAIGVLVFAGLTAYDTQRLKNEYLYYATQQGGETWVEKSAIMGALSLYLNFINMFMMLLQLFGSRE